MGLKRKEGRNPLLAFINFCAETKPSWRKAVPGPAERSPPRRCRGDARAVGSGMPWKWKTIWEEEQQPVSAIHRPSLQRCPAPLKAAENTRATGSSAGSRHQPSRCVSVIGFGD